MRTIISCTLSFALGAVCGFIFYKKQYEAKANERVNEEIRKIVESQSSISSEAEKPEAEEPNDIRTTHIEKPDIMTYARTVNESNYINYSRSPKEQEMVKDEDLDVKTPIEHYVIAPEDFGIEDGYSTIALTYYADGVIADDGDTIMDDVEKYIGFDALNHFGEYEEDTVYVRNERYRIDYEICKDLRTYVDVVGGPYPPEG